MRRTLIMLTICVLMLTAVAATTTVSAAPAGKVGAAGNADVRYVMRWSGDPESRSTNPGEFTINFKSGHYTADWTVRAPAINNFRNEPIDIAAHNLCTEPASRIIIPGSQKIVPPNGHVHWEGTLSKRDLGWLKIEREGCGINNLQFQIGLAKPLPELDLRYR